MMNSQHHTTSCQRVKYLLGYNIEEIDQFNNCLIGTKRISVQILFIRLQLLGMLLQYNSSTVLTKFKIKGTCLKIKGT